MEPEIDFAMLSVRIRSKLASLKETIDSINASGSEEGFSDSDELTRADAIESSHRTARTIGILTRQYKGLELALRRIDARDPEYGYCEECGERIAVERLVAVPESGLCIDCAKALG